MATAAVRTAGGEGDEREAPLQADFCLSDSASEPIHSLLEILDKCAEFWLGRDIAPTHQNEDRAEGVAFARWRNKSDVDVVGS